LIILKKYLIILAHHKNIEIEDKDMGYRSEVVLAVSKEMTPHFLTVLARSQRVRELVSDADVFDKDYADGGMLMYWTGVKWYESYEDVAAIDKFVCDCESEALEGWNSTVDGEAGANAEWTHIRFVRIGEEFDDIQCKGEFSYDTINIQRSIEF